MTNHNVDPCCVQLGPELFDHPAWTCFEPCLGAFDQKNNMNLTVRQASHLFVTVSG